MKHPKKCSNEFERHLMLILFSNRKNAMVENSRFRVCKEFYFTSGFNLVGPAIHRSKGAT
jgi:hypothetical protein